MRRTWAPVGATPVLTGFGRHRDKTSVIAALSVSPVRRQLGLSFRTDAHDYLGNTDVADFVRQVLRQLRGPVMVVWDRGSNHRGSNRQRRPSKPSMSAGRSRLALIAINGKVLLRMPGEETTISVRLRQR